MQTGPDPSHEQDPAGAIAVTAQSSSQCTGAAAEPHRAPAVPSLGVTWSTLLPWPAQNPQVSTQEPSNRPLSQRAQDHSLRAPGKTLPMLSQPPTCQNRKAQAVYTGDPNMQGQSFKSGKSLSANS